MPVLLALHGSAGSGAAFVAEAGWDELAARERVLVIAPDGLPLQPDLEPDPVLNPRLWNSGQHADDRPRSRIDDLAFFDALLDDVARRWPVDPGRVYVVGHSCGGAMALRLAAERSDRIAAVASVAGLAYVDRPAGAGACRPGPDLRRCRPAPAGRGRLLDAPLGAEADPADQPTRSATGRRRPAARPTPGRVVHDGSSPHVGFAPGPDGATVTAVLLDGHGHAWPGGRDRRPPVAALVFGPRTDAIDATAVIWADLSRHRL